MTAEADVIAKRLDAALSRLAGCRPSGAGAVLEQLPGVRIVANRIEKAQGKEWPVIAFSIDSISDLSFVVRFNGSLNADAIEGLGVGAREGLKLRVSRPAIADAFTDRRISYVSPDGGSQASGSKTAALVRALAAGHGYVEAPDLAFEGRIGTSHAVLSRNEAEKPVQRNRFWFYARQGACVPLLGFATFALAEGIRPDFRRGFWLSNPEALGVGAALLLLVVVLWPGRRPQI